VLLHGFPNAKRDHSLVPLRYIRIVREPVRNSFRFFLWATIAAVALRLLFIFRFPAVTTDSFVYGDIAKSWLRHGIYGLSGPAEITPTDIRLPGYPAFLAAVFAVPGSPGDADVRGYRHLLRDRRHGAPHSLS